MSKLRADIERFYLMRGHTDSVSQVQFFRGCLNPRMAPVVLLRFAEIADGFGLGILAKLIAMLNFVVFSIEVSPKVTIGGGLFLPHTAGTVIGADQIGENCTIMQGVTLGSAEPEMGYSRILRPIVGNGVFIGAGAKVIGRLTVGDHAKIGANAVVVKDVPSFAVAVGVPAKILKFDDPSTGQS